MIARRVRPRRSTKAQAADPYTLIVALDKEQQAHGSVYIDDGTSFDFLSGSFVEASISMADGVLKYQPTHAGFSSPAVFERVVVYGHATAQKDGAAQFAFTQQESTGEVSRGSEGAGMAGRDVLVLRKPAAPVAAAWELELAAK